MSSPSLYDALKFVRMFANSSAVVMIYGFAGVPSPVAAFAGCAKFTKTIAHPEKAMKNANMILMYVASSG